MGYKTCHVLNSSLDATVCAKDCDHMKKHYFAQECKAKGGMYKCCIRRDAAFCHECRYLIWYIMINGKKITHHLQRFCCTLSLCTYPAPTLHFWEIVGGQNTSFSGPNGKSNTVFDDMVSCFSPIFFHCRSIIFAAGYGSERWEEQQDSKWVVLQRAAHVQGLGLPLPGSLQSQRPDKMEDLWYARL